MLLYGFIDYNDAINSTNFWTQNLDVSTLTLLVADKFDNIDYSVGSASFIFTDEAGQYYIAIRNSDDFQYQSSVTTLYQMSPKSSFLEYMSENPNFYPNFTYSQIEAELSSFSRR